LNTCSRRGCRRPDRPAHPAPPLHHGGLAASPVGRAVSSTLPPWFDTMILRTPRPRQTGGHPRTAPGSRLDDYRKRGLCPRSVRVQIFHVSKALMRRNTTHSLARPLSQLRSDAVRQEDRSIQRGAPRSGRAKPAAYLRRQGPIKSHASQVTTSALLRRPTAAVTKDIVTVVIAWHNS